MERFADPADEAEYIEGEIVAMRIARIRAMSKELRLDNPSGLCWYCEAETGNERRFCNRDCAAGFEREQ